MRTLPHPWRARSWSFRLLCLVALALVLPACGDDESPAGPMPEPPPEPSCQQNDAQFVREATLALLGRRPLSEAETRAGAELIAQIDELEGRDGVGRRAFARALMGTPAFIDRWQELVLDALQVPRTDVQALADCYDVRLEENDDARLARYVRDHRADELGKRPFTFLDLLRSSLALDDLSPIYRAHLFAMLTRPNFCGNVDPIAQELALRQEVGHVFDAAYTNRDQTCLACHNSERSVTYRLDARDNRHFPIAAKLEAAVFGKSEGSDERAVHGVFRTTDFLVGFEESEVACSDDSFPYCSERLAPTCDGGGQPSCPDGNSPTCTREYELVCPEPASSMPRELSPWGASEGCGVFNREVEADPAGVKAHIASVRGARATVFDLEQALARGVTSLAEHGLRVSEQGDVDDRDAAFAYLVALNIVDTVWREVVGSSLTISTRFPRTQAAHDVLANLTDHFVAEHFSLKTLLLDILQTYEFNALAPEEGCGKPYALAPVFNPWVRDEAEPARRHNSAADGVHPLSPRTLLSATYAALAWPVPEKSRFPGAMSLGGEEPEVPSDEVDEACWLFESCDEVKSFCAAEQACCEVVPLYCEELPEEATSDPELTFQRSIGVFLSISQKGFRGLDLGARLAWEARFGSCQKPEGVARDAVDTILARAQKKKARVEDVVLALKDRLVGEPRIEPDERELLAALLGVPLAARTGREHEPGYRRLCGALLSSPDHLLGGLPARGGSVAELGPTRTASCQALAALSFPRYEVRCIGSHLRVDRAE